ncbi:MAG: ATP synthase F1 subunit delta [Bacteroidales bacterium]|jgi:F-type H+-transporting ATPase subunit delta|nr:ATP synthase F1 subunit delta [Bacteroidales bacterium]
MNESRISVRYARALFETALEKKLLEVTGRDMKLLEEVSHTEEFIAFAGNPTIAPSVKTRIFNSAFSGSMSPLSMSLAGLVIKNGRENHFRGIARNYLAMMRKHLGITEVLITTAVKPAKETLGKLESMISGIFNTKVEMKEETNPLLIGGFVIRIDDKLIDASVRYKLEKMRKVMAR